MRGASPQTFPLEDPPVGDVRSEYRRTEECLRTSYRDDEGGGNRLTILSIPTQILLRACQLQEAWPRQYQGGLPWDFNMVLVGNFVLRRGVGLALISGVASGEVEANVLDASVFTDSLR